MDIYLFRELTVFPAAGKKPLFSQGSDANLHPSDPDHSSTLAPLSHQEKDGPWSTGIITAWTQLLPDAGVRSFGKCLDHSLYCKLGSSCL